MTAGVIGLGIQAGLSLAGLGPKSPKPQTTETSKKEPIPARVYGYGRRRYYGASVLYETASDGSTVDVYAFLDGQAQEREQVYLNDDKVTLSGNVVQPIADKAYQKGRVKVGFTLGAATNTAFAAVIAKLGSIWTSAHRGDGVVTGYLIKDAEKEKDFLTTYPQGDNVQLSAVFKTQLCFDPRTGNTAWTENPVLHLLHYLTVRRNLDYNKRILPTVQYWINAANICDEAVALRDGGSEPRYRSCVSYESIAQPKEVIASLLETFDGWIAPRGDGALIVYAGKLYTPTVTLGPDDIISYRIQKYVEDENYIDQLTVSYVSEPHDWNVVECTPWGGEEGARRTDAISPQTPSYSQNRRLAKRFIARQNAPKRGSVTTNLAGRRARGQRYILLDLREPGYEPFDGIPTLVEITSLQRDFAEGGLTIEWSVVDPNIDAWNPATEQGYPQPVGNVVAKEPLADPTITTASAVYTGSTDDGTGVRITINASGAPGDGVTWFARFREVGAAVWNEQQYDDTDPSGDVVLTTAFVPANTSVEVEVAYRAGDGRVSDYSDPYVVDTRTDLTPPDAATSITLTNWSDTLDLVTDPIARAASYRWRFYGSDGTTLVRTIITNGRTVSYSSAQAATDGARRAYIVKVAGVNAAGAGTEASTATLTLNAPAAVTGVTASQDSPGNGKVEFTLISGVAGYSVAVSTAANFNPLTQGFITKSFGTPTYIQNIAAGTYYAKVAAFDAWTDRPDLLNYSTEATFTITGSSGGTGGGGGGGGGGYCVTEDTPVLMADGSHKRAGDIVAGERVWTQHEDTMEWGAFTVYTANTVDSDDVWHAQIGANGLSASGDHRVWLSGSWVYMKDIGIKVGSGRVVQLTVEDAHTYVSAGILSHNLKQDQPNQN